LVGTPVAEIMDAAWPLGEYMRDPKAGEGVSKGSILVGREAVRRSDIEEQTWWYQMGREQAAQALEGIARPPSACISAKFDHQKGAPDGWPGREDILDRGGILRWGAVRTGPNIEPGKDSLMTNGGAPDIGVA